MMHAGGGGGTGVALVNSGSGGMGTLASISSSDVKIIRGSHA